MPKEKLMALAGKTPQALQHGPRCTVCRALVELPKADAAQLDAWLRDPSISCGRIAAECREDPDTPNLHRTSLERHVRGECLAGIKLRG